MRITFLKDTIITEDEVNELQVQFSDFFDNFEVQYFVHERDFSYYPTFKDSDGDLRPSNDFLVQETDYVFNKYGNWGTDHVVLLIHEDNWLSPTIWGTNYSNIFHGYQVHYCRLDRDNKFNSVGTLYHELMHSFDALILTETGQNIANFLNIENWDRSIVHGQNYLYDYIRYNENLEAVDYIEPMLKQAYLNRKERFDQEYKGLQKTVVQLLQMLVVLLRQQFNRKNGINKLCSNHTH